ncbi:DUF924 family protein [Thermomonas sp.]|uniref:DUF924 family protein n=1 Tax=Thermomonas sp. TaxID=1971895 RepID=UPI002488F97E|nr:DUF924 family protein [Thermomonas sp.]MDI1252709.1 DUF924 family protein [Thermomonas sp.]
MSTPAQVIAYWREAGPGKWFNGGKSFDDECRQHFGEGHMAAARRELDSWMDTPKGVLALLLLLDQIPRNIFRGSGHAFATDGLALQHASNAVEVGLDAQVDSDLRAFMYLPFEHCEDMTMQDRSVELMAPLGQSSLGYAHAHRNVIKRFGRFPHRNAALGRASTPEEQDWLDAGGGF